MTSDEYKVELQRLAQGQGLPISIDQVKQRDDLAYEPANGPHFEVFGSFWGGRFTAMITQQALDTSLLGARIAEGLDQRIVNAAAYKRIDAIIKPARELDEYIEREVGSETVTKMMAVGSPMQILRGQLWSAIRNEMKLRSEATTTPATVPTEPAPPGPDEP